MNSKFGRTHLKHIHNGVNTKEVRPCPGARTKHDVKSAKGGQVVRKRKTKLEMHGRWDVIETSGRLSLKTLLSLETHVVRTEDTITQNRLNPRKRGTADEKCNVQNVLKKPNDLSAMSGYGNLKKRKERKQARDDRTGKASS